MKKILLITLFLLATISFGQTTVANKLKINNNVKQNGATRISVQDSLTKEVNWILKSSVLSRANHTGEQAISTITDLQDSLTSTTERIKVLEDVNNLETNFTGQAYAIWTGSGLVYDVIYPTYYIEGVLYPAGNMQVTLDPSDPTNPRLDVIAVDATGAIKITGIPDPSPVIPTIDPTTQISITTVFINANATTPSNTSNIDVYKENTEWTTTSTIPSAILNSTSTPLQGTTHIDVTAFSSGQILKFVDGQTHQVTDIGFITFAVNLKAQFNNNTRFSIKLYNGNTLISSTVSVLDGQYNFNRLTVDAYKLIVIPISAFSFTNSSFDRIDIVMVGSNSTGFRMDNVILSKGTTPASSTQRAIATILTDSGTINATVADDIISIYGANGLTTSGTGKSLVITPLAPSTTITDGVTATSPNENVVFDALATKENTANKQNSLAVDGTGTKFPTVDAVNAGITEANHWNKTGNDITNNNTGDVKIKPSYRFSILNSSNTPTASIFSNGRFATTNGYSVDEAGSAGMFSSGDFLQFKSNNGNSSTPAFSFTPSYFVMNNAAGANVKSLYTGGIYNPTLSSSAGFIQFEFNPTINQTGTANQIVRSIYINPVLTSAFDYRAIEVVTGKVLLPSTTDIGSVSSTEIGYVDGATSNIQTQLNTKITANTSTNNYIPKVSGTNTFANSRLFDNGTYLGIGTVNAPTKDITFGNQGNREIGIEESSNTIIGRDLTISAGRTINYTSSDFTALNQVANDYKGIAAAVNGNLYTFIYNGGNTKIYTKTSASSNFVDLANYTLDNYIALGAAPNGDVYALSDTYYGNGAIYKQTNGTGTFVNIGAPSRTYNGIAITPTNDVYVIAANEIYKQTNGTGSFVALLQNSKTWGCIAAAPNGDIYVASGGELYKQTNGTGNFIFLSNCPNGFLVITPNNNMYVSVYGGDIYKQTNLTGPFVALGQVSRNWQSLSAASNGNVYACVIGQDIYVQNNNITGTANLDGGSFKAKAGTGKGTGTSNLEFYTGQKLASGTDMQIETLRAKIDNEGLMTLPSTTNAIIEADLTGKAVVTKEYLQSAPTIAKTYKTYFINSATGNNATGVYEDPTHPFATIDYVLGLPGFKSGDIIYLQNKEGTFPINGLFPDEDIIFRSDVSVTISFSSNNNGDLYGTHNLYQTNLVFDIPFGHIINERSGASGCYFNKNVKLNITIIALSLYWNTSTYLALPHTLDFQVKTVSHGGSAYLFHSANLDTVAKAKNIYINEYICLTQGVRLGAGIPTPVTIALISGSGSYNFGGGNYVIKKVTTTEPCYSYANGYPTAIHFDNSTITTTNGLELVADPIFDIIISGNIFSCTKVYASRGFRGNNNIKFFNFSANLGAGTLTMDYGTYSFENCTIKSNGSPITFIGSNTFNLSLSLKNSVFEMVTPAPLVTGGLSSGNTIKLAGVSTNATMISDQIGTGVTVTQFTNY